MRIKEIYSGDLGATLDPLPLVGINPSSGLTLSQFQHYNGFTYVVKASQVGTGAGTVKLYESIDGTNWSEVVGASVTLNNTTAKFVKIHHDDAVGDQLPLGPKLKFKFTYDAGVNYIFTITAVLCHKEK